MTAGKLTAASLRPLVEDAEGSDPALAVAARSRLMALADDPAAFADDATWAWLENLIASWMDPEG